MTRVLGSKASTPDAAWRRVRAAPFDFVTRAELEATTSRAIARVRRYATTQPVVGWSSGKDSLVAWDIVLRAEVGARGVFCVPSDELQFADLRSWLRTHTPGSVDVETTPVTLDWFTRSPQHMFYKRQAKPAAIATRLNRVLHWVPQRAYCARVGRSLFVTGRRTIDGNVCGRDGYTPGEGFSTLNPLFDWSHEEVLAYLAFHRIELPPCYEFEGGFQRGVQPWAFTSRELISLREPALLVKHGALIARAEATFK